MTIRARTAALLLCVLPLTACTGGGDPEPEATGPVDVVAPLPGAPAVASACQALVQDLPQVVGDGLARRPVTGDAGRTAAWGDPAVTLRCGTGPSGSPGVDGAPFSLGEGCLTDPPTAGCLQLLQRDVGPGNAFTTYGRTVNVEITVPDDYDVQVVQSMLPALVAALPLEAVTTTTTAPTPTSAPSAYPTVSASPSGG